MLLGSATVNPAGWTAIIGRLVGPLLFAVAAFVPPVRLRRPRRAQGLAAIGVLGILVLIAVLPRVFGSGSDQTITPAVGSHVNAALAVVQILAAVLAVAATVGYLRRFERLGDEFYGWLAIAAILAAAAHLDYASNPTIYSPQVSLGDILRFCSVGALLTGSMREIRSFWHALASAAVAEERRRIARDLHDGLSQELAYLGRNLSSLQGAADEETLHRLQACIDRARLASRQAIDMIAAPGLPADRGRSHRGGR